MKKPKNTKSWNLEVYEDGSGYGVELSDGNSDIPYTCIKKCKNTKELKKLRKWLKDVINYLETK